MTDQFDSNLDNNLSRSTDVSRESPPKNIIAGVSGWSQTKKIIVGVSVAVVLLGIGIGLYFLLAQDKSKSSKDYGTIAVHWASASNPTDHALSSALPSGTNLSEDKVLSISYSVKKGQDFSNHGTFYYQFKGQKDKSLITGQGSSTNQVQWTVELPTGVSPGTSVRFIVEDKYKPGRYIETGFDYPVTPGISFLSGPGVGKNTQIYGNSTVGLTLKVDQPAQNYQDMKRLNVKVDQTPVKNLVLVSVDKDQLFFTFTSEAGDDATHQCTVDLLGTDGVTVWDTIVSPMYTRVGLPSSGIVVDIGTSNTIYPGQKYVILSTIYATDTAPDLTWSFTSTNNVTTTLAPTSSKVDQANKMVIITFEADMNVFKTGMLGTFKAVDLSSGYQEVSTQIVVEPLIVPISPQLSFDLYPNLVDMTPEANDLYLPVNIQSSFVTFKNTTLTVTTTIGNNSSDPQIAILHQVTSKAGSISYQLQWALSTTSNANWNITKATKATFTLTAKWPNMASLSTYHMTDITLTPKKKSDWYPATFSLNTTPGYMVLGDGNDSFTGNVYPTTTVNPKSNVGNYAYFWATPANPSNSCTDPTFNRSLALWDPSNSGSAGSSGTLGLYYYAYNSGKGELVPKRDAVNNDHTLAALQLYSISSGTTIPDALQVCGKATERYCANRVENINVPSGGSPFHIALGTCNTNNGGVGGTLQFWTGDLPTPNVTTPNSDVF